MKKIVALVLAVLMVAGCVAALSSCKKNDETDKKALKVIDIPLTDEVYAFAVAKGDTEMLTALNSFLAEIKANGKFDEICSHYFGDGEPVGVESAAYDASKDQLVVATNAAFEPFEYTIGDKYAGIDMEIAGALAEYLGVELVVQNMDFDAVCLSVGQHKCDVAMAGLTVKPDREEYVTFSDSYYSASQQLIVTSDDTEFDSCKTADDVNALLAAKDSKVKIGVQNGTTGQFYVEGDADWGFTGFAAQSVGYKSGSLAVQDLLNGNIQYVIIDAAPAKCITEAINKMQ